MWIEMRSDKNQIYYWNVKTGGEIFEMNNKYTIYMNLIRYCK